MSTARDRLLATASRLFYAEGVHTVGIDRVIAEAGVAKATFYHHFKSKDDLVVAYLTTEYERQRRVIESVPATGMDRIRLVLTKLAEIGLEPGFRGCPFLNAAAEFADPAHPVRKVVDDYREWYRSALLAMLRDAGRSDAEQKADFLLLVRDGLAMSGGLGDAATVHAGVETALAVL